MNKTFKTLALLSLTLLIPHTALAYEDRPEPSKQDFQSKILQKFDVNKDNKISKGEAPSKMKRHFDKHDLNGDGFIAGAELDTLPKHKRKNNGERPPREQKD
jgi:Ca2+-binding EF-hand superfamily protein